MPVIKLPLLYVGSKGEKKLYTSLDNATNISCINPYSINEMENPVRLGVVRKTITAGGNNYTEIKHAVCLDFYIHDILLSDEFFVIPTLSQQVIIGAATLRKWRIKLDFENNTIIVNPEVAKLQLI